MQTDLTRMLGIEAPIVQGSFGPWTSVALSAAVSETAGSARSALRSWSPPGSRR